MQKITMGALFLLCSVSTSLISQSVGDYRTRASGDWSMAQNWQVFNGSSWGNIGTPPTGTETITILEADSIFVAAPVTITGTVVNQGILDAVDSLTITIGDGGTYQHDRDAGKIPKCIWGAGSTILITGVSTTAPDDRGQNYHHMTFNTPDLLSNLNMNLKDNTISGDIRVINTGLARWYLTTALATETSTVILMGDVFVEDGTFSVQGTSNALTTFIVQHYGNIEVTGGNFSISRGSQGGGTTTWNLYEGNFSMSNATTQSSTATVGGAKFVFAKQGTQMLTLGDGNTLNTFPLEVSSGTTLDMGSSILSGSGIFIANVDATLITALAGGIDEIFSAVVGQVTLEDESGYGFNGTVAQITSTRMPATVGDLIIDNAAGVTLSQETTFNGVLRLVSGELDNTITLTQGPNGSVLNEGGSLLFPILSIESYEQNIPKSFFVDQNYPNPFNPTTTIRFGLPTASFVTASLFNMLGQEVANLYEGRLNAGEHELQYDAVGLSSGVYIYRIQAGERVSIKRMVLLK